MIFSDFNANGIVIIGIMIFLFGIVIGSFLNVCIYRIPKSESLVVNRSHCMSCSGQLRWYELIPLFSWIAIRGKCLRCKAPISKQYPIIEALNGLFYILIFWICGISIESALYCLLFSALLVLSVIDFRTFEIPVGINIFILTLGLVRLALDYSHWGDYVIGLLSVSTFLAILYYASKGRAMGGGDVKLMGAAGLLLGWQLIILAFFLGCILGSIIHVARMKITKADHVLAMGPYLSLGIFISALWGNQLIDWYLYSRL